MSRFSISCFGVGDGWASADRNHSSFLYQVGNTTLLIDCGEPASRSFRATGLPYDALDGLLLSHLHSDHFGGFLMLMQTFWLENRRRALPIHMPADAVEPVQQLLKSVYLFPELMSFERNLIALRPSEPFTVGELRVTAFPTTHLEQLRRRFQTQYPGDYQAFCFLIEMNGVRLAHSCDIGAPQDLEPLLREPVDTLVCELAHFPAEALFEFLKGREIRQLILVHLSRDLWGRRDSLLKEAQRALPKVSVTIARDGDVVH